MIDSASAQALVDARCSGTSAGGPTRGKPGSGSCES